MLESRQVAAVARAEIIQDNHLGLTLEVFDDVRTDETGTTSDKDFHELLDECLHGRQLGFNGFDELELGPQAVEVMLRVLDFEVHVPVQPVSQEA